jgi:hypothetical protein
MEALELLIRNTDAERVFGRYGYVNERERVETQIFPQTFVPGYLGRVHVGGRREKPGEHCRDVVRLHGSYLPAVLSSWASRALDGRLVYSDALPRELAWPQGDGAQGIEGVDPAKIFWKP